MSRLNLLSELLYSACILELIYECKPIKISSVDKKYTEYQITLNYAELPNVENIVLRQKTKELSEESLYLESIFPNIDVGIPIEDNLKTTWIYPIKPIVSTAYNYPKSEIGKGRVLNETNDLKELISNSLNGLDTEIFINRLWQVLFLYGTYVSAAILGGPKDVAFIDKLKTDVFLGRISSGETKNDANLLMIKGDISGIQKYIYSDINDLDKPAKRLRGRSFLVGLLTTLVLERLIETSDLKDEHILFNTGGHFVLVIPNETEMVSKLMNTLNKCNEELVNQFSGKLLLVVAQVETTNNELETKYNEVYQRLDKAMMLAKFRPHESTIRQFFIGNKNGIGLESSKRLSTDEIMLGEKLPKSNCMIIGKHVENSEIKLFGLSIKLYDTTPKQVKASDNLLLFNPSINDLKQGLQNSFGRVIPVFTGNYLPKQKNGSPIEFHEFHQFDIETEHHKLNAVFRLDVDDLGLIFSKGLKKIANQPYHVARLLALSREMQLFFTQEVNNLAKEYNIYIAYSGGDDVFAVGSWRRIIDFGIQLRKQFSNFACQNPNLRASAGISIIKQKFPIEHSAKWAGEAEEIAKNFSDEKNSIAIFDIGLKWNQLDQTFNLSKRLLTQLNEKAISEQNDSFGLVFKLLDLVNKTFDESKAKIDPNRMKPMLHYLFARKGVTYAEYEKMKVQNQEGEATVVKEFAKWFLDFNAFKENNERRRFKVLAHLLLYQYRGIRPTTKQ